LWLPEDEGGGADLAEARTLFPGGQPRKFTAAELLLSWLAEPKKWEHVPFLAAEHKQLREEVLRLPGLDAEGRRLRYISPWKFQERVDDDVGMPVRPGELAVRIERVEAQRERREQQCVGL
jgi:hypothetical protein